MNKIYETRINKLTSCEDWLTNFLLSKDISKDLNGEPLRFPKLINNNSFKKPLKFNFDNWAVGYASRNSLKSELDTTKIIENMFVKFNKNIKIKNNYNNIANKILKKAEKSKINVKPVYDNELHKTINSAFYERNKYYYYNNDNKEYAISDTGWNPTYKYYTNVNILNDFINVPSDQFYMANKYYKELSIGSGIYTLAT